MGVGHVPQEPVRSEGQGPVVQGRQRGGAAPHRPQPVAVSAAGGPSTPDRSRQARGRFGEEEAARWYERAGYTVLDRNWRCDIGELDLVLTRGGIVVFSEVKARADDRFGGGAAAVDARKQHKVRTLAIRWLAAHPDVRRIGLRFDVAAVTGATVRVIESAF